MIHVLSCATLSLEVTRVWKHTQWALALAAVLGLAVTLVVNRGSIKEFFAAKIDEVPRTRELAWSGRLFFVVLGVMLSFGIQAVNSNAAIDQLTEEHIAILVSADNLFVASPNRIYDNSLSDAPDKEKAARYRSAFRELLAKGHLEFVGVGDNVMLTVRGEESLEGVTLARLR